MLTKDQIFKAAKLKTEKVSVPEWGGDIVVTELSGRDREKWESEVMSISDDGTAKLDGTSNVRAKLIALTVIGDDGKRVFDDSDAGKIGGLPSSGILKVFEVAARLSGLDGAEGK